MSASPPPQFCLKDHRIIEENSPSSGKERQLASPRMPKRYESDEEEMSEADTAGREEHCFSTADLESDAGVSERGDDAFTLNMSEEHCRPTSVHTIKPDTHSNVLTPMPLLLRQQENHESNTASRPDSASRYPPSGSSASQELDSPPHPQSFHGDAGPFDEDQVVDVHFLTATPITYYTPACKPSIVFVPPSHVSTGGRNTNRKPRKPSFTRQPSTRSSRSNNGSIKRRCRPRVGKDADNRSSTLATEVLMNSHLFPRETMPSFSDGAAVPSRRSRRSSSVYSRSDAEAASWSADAENSRWPSPQQGSTEPNRERGTEPPRTLEQSTRPRAGRRQDEMSVNQQHSHSSGQRAREYRNQAGNAIPVSEPIGVASSRPRQYLSKQTAPNGHRQTQHPISRNAYKPSPRRPRPTASEFSYATNNHGANVQEENTPQFGAWRDSTDSAPPVPFDDRQSRRRRSLVPGSRRPSSCSTASGSSKHSMPAPEAHSVRSIITRHRRQHDSGSTSSAQSSFGRNSPFSEYGDSSGASRSTSNLGYYARASSDMPSRPWGMDDSPRTSAEQRREGEHLAAQRPARSKGAKWLTDKSESVGQAKSKAVNGIGSMLKRTAYPE